MSFHAPPTAAPDWSNYPMAWDNRDHVVSHISGLHEHNKASKNGAAPPVNQYESTHHMFEEASGSTRMVSIFNHPGRDTLNAPLSQIGPEIAVSYNSQPHSVITNDTVFENFPVFNTTEGQLAIVHDENEFIDSMCFRERIDPVQMATRVERKISSKLHAHAALTHVPRPVNRFILFRNEQAAILKETFPGIGNNDISRQAAQMWRDASEEVKQKYTEMARNLAEEHRVLHPNYRYTPRKSNAIMRRKRTSIKYVQLPHNINGQIVFLKHGPTPAPPKVIDGDDLDVLSEAFESSTGTFTDYLDGIRKLVGTLPEEESKPF